ncbi:hypothetical protein V8E36_008366 [Tilletia maclaganii]
MSSRLWTAWLCRPPTHLCCTLSRLPQYSGLLKYTVDETSSMALVSSEACTCVYSPVSPFWSSERSVSRTFLVFLMRFFVRSSPPASSEGSSSGSGAGRFCAPLDVLATFGAALAAALYMTAALLVSATVSGNNDAARTLCDHVVLGASSLNEALLPGALLAVALLFMLAAFTARDFSPDEPATVTRSTREEPGDCANQLFSFTKCLSHAEALTHKVFHLTPSLCLLRCLNVSFVGM